MKVLNIAINCGTTAICAGGLLFYSLDANPFMMVLSGLGVVIGVFVISDSRGAA